MAGALKDFGNAPQSAGVLARINQRAFEKMVLLLTLAAVVRLLW
jgi:hypothetical protein